MEGKRQIARKMSQENIARISLCQQLSKSDSGTRAATTKPNCPFHLRPASQLQPASPLDQTLCQELSRSCVIKQLPSRLV